MNFLSIGFKAFNILDAAVNIAQVINDKHATQSDKIAAVIQGIFIGAEIGDLTVNNIQEISSGVQFGMSVAASGTDMGRFAARTYVRKVKAGEQWTIRDTLMTAFEGGTSAFFRFGDVMGVAENLSASLEHIQLCQQLATYATAGQAIGAIGNSVVRLPTNAKVLHRSIQRYLVERKLRERRKNDHPCIEMETKVSMENAYTYRGYSPELDYRDVLQLFRYAARLDSLPSIPPIIADDPAFIHHCPITGKPIRFILVPNLPEDLRNDDILDIVYERAAIEEWIKNTPNEAPPNWPIDLLPLPLKNNSLMVDAPRQADINRIIQRCIQEIQIAYLHEHADQN